MSLANILKVQYSKIPGWMLKLGGVIYYTLPQKIRYGTVYYKTKKYIHYIDSLSEEELQAQIDLKFVEVVKHAYCHVPFYKNFYNENGVDINTITGTKDIYKLPFIDKETIRKHGLDMIADNVDKNKLIYVTTSGSTGNPAGFYQPDNITMEEWAYTMNIWNRVGCDVASKRLVLRGKKLHPGSRGKNFYYDPLRRELSCNVFDMRESTMAEYCKAIEKYKPDFIHGYMSAIITLARYIDKNNINLKHCFKAILATSENIIDAQKNYVQYVFKTRVFSFYGHSERLIIAGECEKSSDYHVEPLYGFCEIVDENGNSTDEGEMVSTGFLNNAMPLIRYKTGDEAKWSKKIECPCGRKHKRIEKVTGRWHQDMLLNEDGAFISLTALNIHTIEFDKIVRYKFVQKEKGLVKMFLQVSEELNELDIQAISKVLDEKTNNKIKFEINIVENIPVLKNGKYRIVEQYIEI